MLHVSHILGLERNWYYNLHKMNRMFILCIWFFKVIKSLQNRYTKNLGHDSSLMYDTDLNTATNIMWSQWSVLTSTKNKYIYIYTHTHVCTGRKKSVYLQVHVQPQCLKMHYFITMSITCKTKQPVCKVSNFDTELSFELCQNTRLVLPF